MLGKGSGQVGGKFQESSRPLSPASSIYTHSQLGLSGIEEKIECVQ